MGFWELFLTTVGLSMDAFAVSMCKGLRMRAVNWKYAVVIGLFFGGFQAAMPLVGWVVGKQFERYITAVDHWVVFALLAFIGGKMIVEALRGEAEGDCGALGLDLKELTVLAFATSVDALAVGISFAFLQVDIAPAVATIGLVTFALSIVGVAVGCKFGAKFQKQANLLGGVILVLIGVKILLEHLLG